MSVDFDTSDLDDLARDLAAMGNHVRREVKPVVTRAGNAIKRDWSYDALFSRHFAQIAPTINYTVTEGTNYVEVEVGPDPRRRAARLANVWLFGGGTKFRGGGGTGQEPLVHLDKELPNAERHLGDIIEEVWG